MLAAMHGIFRYRFRVRYQECDAQKIVFNARWGDYLDLASCELIRAVFGAPEALDWRLARQLIEWKRSGRFDDVLEARLWTIKLGTTSFTLGTSFHRVSDGVAAEASLVTAETVYVLTDPTTAQKRPISEEERQRLGPGAYSGLVDHSGGR